MRDLNPFEKNFRFVENKDYYKAWMSLFGKKFKPPNIDQIIFWMKMLNNFRIVFFVNIFEIFDELERSRSWQLKTQTYFMTKVNQPI